MKPIAMIVLSIIFVFCLSPVTNAADSAFESGSVGLGGTAFLNYDNPEGIASEKTTLFFSASTRYYIYNRLSVGMELSHSSESIGGSSNLTHRYIGKFQYVLPSESWMILFVHAGGGFIRKSGDFSYCLWPPCEGHANGWTIDCGLGFYTFVNDHFALKAKVDFIKDELQENKWSYRSTDQIMISVGFEGFIF